jgi:hypothetical protein
MALERHMAGDENVRFTALSQWWCAAAAVRSQGDNNNAAFACPWFRIRSDSFQRINHLEFLGPATENDSI